MLVRGSNDGVQDRRSDQGLLAALDNSRIDPAESFIVLDDRRGPGAQSKAAVYDFICVRTASGQLAAAKVPTTACCCMQAMKATVCLAHSSLDRPRLVSVDSRMLNSKPVGINTRIPFLPSLPMQLAKQQLAPQLQEALRSPLSFSLAQQAC